CIESRLFRANGNAARGKKREAVLLKSVLSIPVHVKLNRSRRSEVVKKVVDESQKTVDNLASLLLKTQRC
ncbi:enoyl-CoA hydratase, partial [Burkholderia cenocepacia]|uniref:enoyl-CoA hydratase n=1 Tax=Burkholderia cenocepacia TaxID=95486 RepID=UPI001C0D0B4A